MLWRNQNGELSVRYRDDRIAAPVGRDTDLLAWLRAAMASQIVEFRLPVGGGYIVNNHRWLHGRRAFEGERAVQRILIAETAYEVGGLRQGSHE